jgi:hypothetical protein
VTDPTETKLTDEDIRTILPSDRPVRALEDDPDTKDADDTDADDDATDDGGDTDGTDSDTDTTDS